MPNLLAATHNYWRKLNELNAAYQRGEVSLEEVDARVQALMVELGDERRATIRFVAGGLQRFWQEQQELVLGLSLVGALAYAWVTVGTI